MTSLYQAPERELEPGLSASDAGPRALAPFGRRGCVVSHNEPAGRYRLIGAEDPSGPSPLPGQFYMLAAERGRMEGAVQRPFLARAFSVCRSRGSRLDFLVEEIGSGTRMLAELSLGDRLWLVGPLGIGFSSPAELSIRHRTPGPTGTPDRALLVGGGAGVAPLVIWHEALSRSRWDVRVLLGFRSASHCGAAGLLAGEVELATDDGSVGHHGFVSDLLEARLSEQSSDVVYGCGPPDMLEAVRRICEAQSVPAELALEESMACGFGACFGCAVKTASGYRRLCVDGPVVSAADLDESWRAA